MMVGLPRNATRGSTSTHCHRNPMSKRISIFLPCMTFDFCKSHALKLRCAMDGWFHFLSNPFVFSFAKLRTQLNIPIPQNARVLLIFAPSRYRHTRATANWLDWLDDVWREPIELDSDPDDHWPEASTQTMQYRQPAIIGNSGCAPYVFFFFSDNISPSPISAPSSRSWLTVVGVGVGGGSRQVGGHVRGWRSGQRVGCACAAGGGMCVRVHACGAVSAFCVCVSGAPSNGCRLAVSLSLLLFLQ